MNYLINTADIQMFEDISPNIKDNRIKTDIRLAHDLDLRGFFGDAFYYDVLQNIKFDNLGVYDPTTTPQKYKDLYLGVSYTNISGHVITYDGLKPMLIYFAFARFVQMDKYRFTATGPVSKKHESSEPLSQKEIVMITEKARSIANAYANNVEKFLSTKRGDYPLWKINQRNKNSRQPGARIRAVDKTDFNLRSGGGLNNRFGLDNFIY